MWLSFGERRFDGLIENRPTRIPSARDCGGLGIYSALTLQFVNIRTGPFRLNASKSFFQKFVLTLPCRWAQPVRLLAPIVEWHRFRCPKFSPQTTLATAPTSRAYFPLAPKICTTWPVLIHPPTQCRPSTHAEKIYLLLFRLIYLRFSQRYLPWPYGRDNDAWQPPNRFANPS